MSQALWSFCTGALSAFGAMMLGASAVYLLFEAINFVHAKGVATHRRHNKVRRVNERKQAERKAEVVAEIDKAMKDVGETARRFSENIVKAGTTVNIAADNVKQFARKMSDVPCKHQFGEVPKEYSATSSAHFEWRACALCGFVETRWVQPEVCPGLYGYRNAPGDCPCEHDWVRGNPRRAAAKGDGSFFLHSGCIKCACTKAEKLTQDNCPHSYKLSPSLGVRKCEWCEADEYSEECEHEWIKRDPFRSTFTLPGEPVEWRVMWDCAKCCRHRVAPLTKANCPHSFKPSKVRFKGMTIRQCQWCQRYENYYSDPELGTVTFSDD